MSQRAVSTASRNVEPWPPFGKDPTRTSVGPVLSLDLTTDWPTRAGDSQELSSGPRPTSQAWSRAIWEELDAIAALLYPSSMHGRGINVAFYERAECAIPRTPDRDLPLSLPAFEPDLIRFATGLGYGFR